MLVKRSRVQNYKCITDSGWVDTDKVTALVGKNESGKTALLEALQKFSSEGGVQFAPKDFPRDRSKDYTPAQPCVEVEFLLDDGDKRRLTEIIPELAKIHSVKVAKTYGNEFHVNLGLPAEYSPPSLEDLLGPLELDLRARVEPSDESSQKITQILDEFVFAVRNEGVDIPSAWGSAEAKLGQISTTPLAASKVAEIINTARKCLEQINIRLASIATGERKVLELIPKFMYFEDYDIIKGKVNLQEFAAAKASGPLKGEFRTVSNLLTMAKLDVNQLVDLEKAGDAESRAILCHQASTEITGLTTKYWKQRTYRVQFSVDGPLLTTYVLDEINRSPIALEDRSKGFKTQFSFNVNFNATTRAELMGTVLLLDEPGLHLHASAQADMLQLIDDLSANNQIIYSTHSPFMIDATKLERVRICRETYEQDVPQVSDRYWTGDAESVFPLLSALGYDLSQSLFVGRNNVIVEGITDFWYLTTISERLKELGREGLKDTVTLTPVGGAGKVYYMAVFMSGQRLDVVAVLDAETEGRRVKAELIKNKILREKNVLLVSDPFDPATEMDMDDLIPADFYLKLVEESYKEELGGEKLALSAPRHPRIVRSLEKVFEAKGLAFNKTRPASLFLRKFPTLKDELPPELLANFERLIKSINTLFP